MSKENKVSKIEYNKRVTKVFELMVTGVFEFEIIQNVATVEEWNVSQRQIYNYIADASAMFEENAKIHQKKEFGKAITRLNTLFRQSLKMQDIKTALAVQKELNKLIDLYPNV